MSEQKQETTTSRSDIVSTLNTLLAEQEQTVNQPPPSQQTKNLEDQKQKLLEQIASIESKITSLSGQQETYEQAQQRKTAIGKLISLLQINGPSNQQTQYWCRAMTKTGCDRDTLLDIVDSYANPSPSTGVQFIYARTPDPSNQNLTGFIQQGQWPASAPSTTTSAFTTLVI